MREALGDDRHRSAPPAADRQRHRGQGDRARRDTRPAGAPGHRDGALARERADDGGRSASTSFIELGAGKVLSGLCKRIVPDADHAQRRDSRRRSKRCSSCSDRPDPRFEGRGPSMFRLDGKTALVTGASGGLGAKRSRVPCTAQGATVVLSGTRRRGARQRWPDRCRRMRHRRDGYMSVPQTFPIRRRPTRWWRPSEGAAGAGLDILVNNAGLTRDGLALRMKDEDWSRVLEVDLAAPFRLCRAAMKGMVRRRSRAVSSRSPASWASPAMPGRRTTPPPRPA